MLTLLFQDIEFGTTVELSFVMRQGPCSWKSPIILELPGLLIGQPILVIQQQGELTPPLNQRAKGALSGFSRAAKNQNLSELTSDIFTKLAIVRFIPNTLVTRQITIT
jgi:hypothetical protein